MLLELYIFHNISKLLWFRRILLYLLNVWIQLISLLWIVVIMSVSRILRVWKGSVESQWLAWILLSPLQKQCLFVDRDYIQLCITCVSFLEEWASEREGGYLGIYSGGWIEESAPCVVREWCNKWCLEILTFKDQLGKCINWNSHKP